jgi:NTE family protein
MTKMYDKIEQLRSWVGVESPKSQYGLVLSGGGARASYQAGVLSYIAEAFGGIQSPVITGISAGSLNAAHIANHTGGFRVGVHELEKLWGSLTSDDVYEVSSSFQVFWDMFGSRIGGGSDEFFPRAGLVDTSPLCAYLKRTLGAPDGELTGVQENIDAGQISGCAIVGTHYGTGQTVAWVDGQPLSGWDRATRVSHQGRLSVDQIMASTSLPFLFPAIEVGGGFYGDGGIRLADPLSPAVHMGANRILAISTRYGRNRKEADKPVVHGYPPSAQIFSLLLNAIFLDRLDQDAIMMERINKLVAKLSVSQRDGLRPIDLFVIRPSRDLGKLSSEYQSDLEGILSLISNGLGSSDTKSPDWLSMILFEPRYAQRLMEIGYQDAVAERESLARFLDPTSAL